MKIRTDADNRQLASDEVQIEDIRGAVSVRKAPVHGPGVQVTTVRGIRSRKAQFAVLSREGVDALITELTRVRDEVWPTDV